MEWQLIQITYSTYEGMEVSRREGGFYPYYLILESERMFVKEKTLFKNDVQSCSNSRRAQMMSLTIKLWERVVEEAGKRARVVQDVSEHNEIVARCDVGATHGFKSRVGLHQGFCCDDGQADR